MGALTSNRKRGDEYLSVNPGIPSPKSNLQTSAKRARFLFPSMNLQTSVSSKSAIARLSRYPDAKPPLPRLHAPCANLRFGANPRSNHRRPSFERESVSDAADEVMGNFLASNYFRLKNTALAACRYLRGEKSSTEHRRDFRDSEVEEIVVVGASSEDEEEIDVVEDDDHIELSHGNESDTRMEDRAEEASPSPSMLRSEFSGLHLEPGISSVSAYKKLMRLVEERTPRLKELSFEIEVNELKRNFLKSLRPAKEVIPREPFIPLTKEEETEVKRAFSANRGKVLVAHRNSNIEITGQLLQCLRPGAWLNDEVINVYLELLKEREKRDPKSFLKCHFFNTFFYKKLIGGGYDYKSVRRWTTQRKLGYSLADCDKIFVPVHKEIHWCLAVIDKKEEKFQYLDSLGGRDNQVMKALERYYADEVKDKCGKEINLSSWKHEFVEDLPEQQNGFDCGVFMIKYADFYSRGLRLCFSQENMPYFRLRTAKEILRLRAE